MAAVKDVFTPKTVEFVELLSDITDRLSDYVPRRYQFMPRRDFKGMAKVYGKLISERIPERIAGDAVVSASMKVYWTEILRFVHVGAITGLLRQRRWTDAVVVSLEDENYLSFAANLRGLLESSADMYYSLRGVKTLEQAWPVIAGAVSGTATVPFACEELEDSLKHFVYAMKAKAEETYQPPPGPPQPKTGEYIRAIQGGQRGPIHDLYSELCNIVHPATPSLVPFLASSGEHVLEVRLFDELRFICSLCETHGQAIEQLLGRSLNICRISLAMLNLLPIEDLYTPLENQLP